MANLEKVEANFIHNEIFLLYHKYLYYEKSTTVIPDHVFDSALKYGEDLHSQLDKEKYPKDQTVVYMVGFDYRSQYWERCKKKYKIEE